MIKGKR